MRRALVLWTLMLPLLAWAQDNERERLAAQRQALVERYAAEERACRERFVVSSCVDALRERRRVALAPLRERELALEDAQRQQRALSRQAAQQLRAQPASAAGLKVGAEPDGAPAGR